MKSGDDPQFFSAWSLRSSSLVRECPSLRILMCLTSSLCSSWSEACFSYVSFAYRSHLIVNFNRQIDPSYENSISLTLPYPLSGATILQKQCNNLECNENNFQLKWRNILTKSEWAKILFSCKCWQLINKEQKDVWCDKVEEEHRTLKARKNGTIFLKEKYECA